MLQVDLQSRTPIYEQLIRGIVRLKALGVLQPEEKLPSVRQLATSLGINPNTVQKAYQLLEQDGVIYSVNGKGSFLSSGEGAGQSIIKAAKDSLKAAACDAAMAGLPKAQALEICEEAYTERGAKV